MLPSPESLRETCRKIFVRGLRLQCLIGAYSHELGRPQTVELECDVWVERRPASDCLDKVLNYDLIVDALRETALSGHIRLQETLAECAAEKMAALPGVRLVRVSSAKLEAFPDAECAGVEVWRSPSAPT